MKKILIEGYDRQHTAAILLARLGPGRCWFHFLMQAAARGTGLHGSGPTLRPVAMDKHRPVYSRQAIHEFIEQAKAFDPTLRPCRLTPTMYEIPEAALAPPPYRVFRATAAPAP